MRKFAFAAALLLAGAAQAQLRDREVEQQLERRDEPWDQVTITGAITTNLQSDVYGKRTGQRAFVDTYFETEAGVAVNLPYGFGINGVFKFESADREFNGETRWFEAETAWVDELYLNWQGGPLTLFAGKIHPRFGFAWDIGPGLYGTDFGEEYELSEKIGAGATLYVSDIFHVTPQIGEHSLRAEAFRADDSFLTGGLVSRRFQVDDGSGTGRLTLKPLNKRRFGGPDNVDSFGNVVVSAAGKRVPMPIGLLEYNAAVSSRKPGEDATSAGNAATETGYVGGAVWEIPVPWMRLTFAPLVEYAWFEDFGGVQDQRGRFLTAGFDLIRRPWKLSYAYQWNRNDDTAADTGTTQFENAASVTYDLSDIVPYRIMRGTEITAGWRRLHVDGEGANDWGAAVSWGYKF